MKRVMILFSIILSVSLAGASFTLDDNSSSVDTKYAGGDVVTGVMNMSFSNQESDRFKSNFEGFGIELFDLLDGMGYSSPQDYTCNPANCQDDYSIDGAGGTSAQFSTGQKEIYGFRLTASGTITDINVFHFDLGNLEDGNSCFNQLNIDLFNDGDTEYYNDKNSSSVCGNPDYGCFESGIATDYVIVNNDNKFRYCQNLTLPAAPGYRLGAHVIESTGDTSDLRMSLYKQDSNGGGDEIGHCLIDEDVFVGGGQAENVYCNLKHSEAQSFKAYMCIKVKDGQVVADYKIRYEENAPCGGVGYPPDAPLAMTIDYEMYAQPLGYAPVGDITFDDDFYQDRTGKNLFTALENYVSSVYNNTCPNGCIIPIGFWGINREILIDNGLIRYKDGGITKDTFNIYHLISSDFKINSDFLILDVEDMQFEVPNTNGTHDFFLCLDTNQCKDEDDSFFNEEVDVSVGFDFSIGPKFVFIGKPTIFSAFTSESIVGSTWDFGDGSDPVKSNDKTSSHLYSGEGNYTIEVTLEKSNGEESTKKFKIIVGDPESSAEALIKDYESRIAGIKNAIEKFEPWVRDEIKAQISLDDLESALKTQKNKFNGSDPNFTIIVNALVEMDVPYSIQDTGGGTLPAAVGFDNIDVKHIEDISNKESSNDQELKSSIGQWMDQNYEINVDFETISSIHDFGVATIVLGTYKVELTQKSGAGGDSSHLIIDYSFSNLEFKTDYDEKSVSSGAGAEVSIDSEGKPETIEFLVLGGGPSVESLAIYISPVLSIIEGKPICDFDDPDCQPPGFGWGKFWIGIGILFLVMFAAYIGLQAWYKRHYEKHLFKNPNDLYNLINFIYNSRKSGMEDSDIKRKLKEKKWKGEQISYAFKKIDGKRTGLWEIPLFKFAENKKVKRELQKKNPGRPIDTRFIKRPGF